MTVFYVRNFSGELDKWIAYPFLFFGFLSSIGLAVGFFSLKQAADVLIYIAVVSGLALGSRFVWIEAQQTITKPVWMAAIAQMFITVSFLLFSSEFSFKDLCVFIALFLGFAFVPVLLWACKIGR
jgi:hypothetical protein